MLTTYGTSANRLEVSSMPKGLAVIGTDTSPASRPQGFLTDHAANPAWCHHFQLFLFSVPAPVPAPSLEVFTSLPLPDQKFVLQVILDNFLYLVNWQQPNDPWVVPQQWTVTMRTLGSEPNMFRLVRLEDTRVAYAYSYAYSGVILKQSSDGQYTTYTLSATTADFKVIAKALLLNCGAERLTAEAIAWLDLSSAELRRLASLALAE